MQIKLPAVKAKWWIAVGAMIFVIAVGWLGFTYRAELGHQILLSTTRQPEPLTELSFVDPGSLPTVVSQGQKIPLSFIIHNLENSDITYRYRVIFIDDQGRSTQLAEASAHVARDTSQTIPAEVTLPPGQGRGQVVVLLAGRAQSVHFWLDRE